jgi:hypothetical protein
MEDVDIFYPHLVYFTAIWYILWTFGFYVVVIWYIFPVLVCCPKFPQFKKFQALCSSDVSECKLDVLLLKKALSIHRSVVEHRSFLLEVDWA